MTMSMVDGTLACVMPGIHIVGTAQRYYVRGKEMVPVGRGRAFLLSPCPLPHPPYSPPTSPDFPVVH